MLSDISEITLVILAGTFIMFLLVSTIVFFVLSYQKRYLKHQHEIKEMEQAFNQELLKSELEIKDQTMNNIAAEIHDHIGQLLSVIKLNLALNPDPELKETKDLVAQVIKDVRSLAHSMHSDAIGGKSIAELISNEVDRLKKSTPLLFHYQQQGESHTFDPQTEIFLFRIFQECVNNVLKHADAKNVFVELIYGLSLLTISINDDGKGFETETLKEGLGLRSINYRAKLIGAKLDVTSSTGSGTKVRLEIQTDKKILNAN
ncbi:sensor histidine kinase [Desertivirga brevis]|uniref:sensor histidine kinase n=1 Tax=Desertivirga brevis TaxID=2810310 RepID=UPI001A964F8A|nr:sensor histidine kinase [Pedobacter sp. SYSU D00873]